MVAGSNVTFQPVARSLRLPHHVEGKIDLGRSILGVDGHPHREMPGVESARRTDF
jgi:hypothetical protein